MQTNVKSKAVHIGLITGAGFTPFKEVKEAIAVKKEKMDPLKLILMNKVDGFKRLNVKIDEVRIAQSKKAKLRFVVLVEVGQLSEHRLHQCYLCATKMMFHHFKLGDNPYIERPSAPEEYVLKYSAVFNHKKDLQPTTASKYLEFIHTQAELVFRAHKADRWFDHYNSTTEVIK